MCWPDALAASLDDADQQSAAAAAAAVQNTSANNIKLIKDAKDN